MTHPKEVAAFEAWAKAMVKGATVERPKLKGKREKRTFRRKRRKWHKRRKRGSQHKGD